LCAADAVVDGASIKARPDDRIKKAELPYTLKLNDINSEILETLAKERGLSASDFIERIVVGYLDAETLKLGKPPLSSRAKPALDPSDFSLIKNLYKWDKRDGAIVFIPTNERVFLVNARSWNAIEQDLFTKYLSGAAHLLSEMGSAYGRAVALDYRSVTANPENLTSYFVHLGLVAGWGKFSLSGDLEEGSKIGVHVRDCVFCRSRQVDDTKKPSCSFLSAVCKGIADTVFGLPHSVRETKCSSIGDEFCEISIWNSTNSEENAWPPGSNPMTGDPSR